jgi:hypothetical protein
MSASFTAFAQQDSTPARLGLPGDNFNLAAVLDVFRQSPTLESFEASLNADTSRINNLDLNNDGKVDYIRVVDRPEENVHTIVLQTDISEKETQDIAVIFVQKEGDQVRIQMVGDEELYGKNYILEPSEASANRETANPAYQGGNTTIVTYNYYTENNYYNSPPSYAPAPSSWVIVTFLYAPAYRPWRSPWYWGYYPGWWNPWRPFYWDQYYYHWYYHHAWHGWWYWRAHHHHFDPWYRHYRMERRTSPAFTNARREGAFQNTYNNPNPEARPTQKANFPSHNLEVEKNPAIARPGSGARPIDVQPGKDRPTEQRPMPEVKPVEKDRSPEVKPTRPPATRPQTKPTVKPTVPSRQPAARPANPVKQPQVRPAPPAKQPAVKPSRPSKSPSVKPDKAPRSGSQPESPKR